MRKYLFRAKAINRGKGYHKAKYKNGDWVYGLITKLYDDRFPILPMEMRDDYGFNGIEVDYTTVGQYTGLTDKNGNKIFEGDILKHLHTSVEIEPYYEYLEVFYDEETASFYAGYEELWLICGGSEVIGNVFDNPELLEVEND